MITGNKVTPTQYSSAGPSHSVPTKSTSLALKGSGWRLVLVVVELPEDSGQRHADIVETMPMRCRETS